MRWTTDREVARLVLSGKALPKKVSFAHEEWKTQDWEILFEYFTIA